VHRAGAINSDGTPFTGTGMSYNAFLTGTLSTCENCHTSAAGAPSTQVVEWGDPTVVDPNTGVAPTTPSAHSVEAGGGGCTMCHQGSIHGNNSGSYFGMSAYMLGNPANNYWDPNVPTTDIQGYKSQDDRIAAEMAANAASADTNGDKLTDVFYAAPDNLQYVASSQSWVPFFDLYTGAPITASQMAAVKANAAGYTCARTGCHQNSMFSVNKWGFAAPRDKNANATSATDLVSTTGHRTIPGATPVANETGVNTDTALCGPCHPGNYSGGYRQYGGLDATDPIVQSTAYGCDQCHDMVGVTTGTTAWPHGNSQLLAYEWPGNIRSPGVPESWSGYGYSPTPYESAADGTNLWMYRENVAQYKPSVDGVLDGQVTIVKDMIGTSSDTGSVNDGVCLKCHIPVDSSSVLWLANNATNPDVGLVFNGSTQQYEIPFTTKDLTVGTGVHSTFHSYGFNGPSFWNGNPGVYGTEPYGSAGPPSLIYLYK